ncbi:SDR family NAD(P)-dependent oxidoreductase, partial [Mesorhizobium sp. M2A.F.Ca.ET.037.01.1.1]
MSGFDLLGKVAIVTGAQRGIGLGVATELARAGAQVVLTGIKDVDGYRAAANICAMGLAATYRRMDTSDESEVTHVIDDIFAEMGRLDIAVANAAIYPNTNIASITPDEWDSVMAVNLRGPFLLAKACLPYFQRQRHGRVVFLSSITG